MNTLPSLRSKTRLASILLIVSIIVCASGCGNKQTDIEVNTHYTYFIPKKIPTPTKPILIPYNTNEKFDSPTNFKRLQQNTIFIIDYANSLKDVIEEYEKQIDKMNEEKNKLEENSNKKSNN